MVDALAGFLRRQGALVSVEGREFRLGVEGGVVYVNGLPAEQYRDEAEGLLHMPDGSMHLPQNYLEAHGLPSMSLHPTEAGLSARMGTRFFLHAFPNSQLLVGGPGLQQQYVVLIQPGAQIQYGGPEGVVFEAEPQGLQLAILPQNGREAAFLAGGAASAVGIGVLAWGGWRLAKWLSG